MCRFTYHQAAVNPEAQHGYTRPWFCLSDPLSWHIYYNNYYANLYHR